MNKRLEDQWKFPINLESYNKNAHLTEIEYYHIEKLVLRFQEGGKGWHKEAYVALKYLLTPLYDVLDYIGAVNTIKRKRTVRTTVISLLLRSMCQYHMSYWGFSTEIWFDILGKDYYAYIKKHGMTANARQQLIAVSYILCNFNDIFQLGRLSWNALSCKIFGESLVNTSISIILDQLKSWGYTNTGSIKSIRCALSEIFLAQRTPILSDIKFNVLERHYINATAKITKRGLLLLSYALSKLNIIQQSLSAEKIKRAQKEISHRGAIENVSPEWLEVCNKWYQTSTLQHSSKISSLYRILQAGRWFQSAHPELKTPRDWTREICAEYVAAVNKATVGQWKSSLKTICANFGKPIMPKSKANCLATMRSFFMDLQEWGWVTRKFTPSRALATPRSIRALVGPDPRIIDESFWAKIMWASLNLTDEELMKTSKKIGQSEWKTYPPSLIRALAIVWVFSGLRCNEIMRLRVGCIRFQENDNKESKTCLLDVPVNKTNTAFTKPVDIIVGKTISIWEGNRPPQPLWLDLKTNEKVHILFFIRGKPIGLSYLNKVLIPLLCQKANIPQQDVRGKITSHRARATIASQLYNAKEPLTLFELQDWLGHSSPETTRHYTKISPTVMAKSYANAEYFSRNLRTIEVLIDRDAIKNSKTNSMPWKLYDLGHGYCSYDFFEQCPHRMACARCDFYVPKKSSQGQLIEGKNNLLKLRQDIPLTETELAAVDGDLSAYEKLINKLENEPAPSDIKTTKS